MKCLRNALRSIYTVGRRHNGHAPGGLYDLGDAFVVRSNKGGQHFGDALPNVLNHGLSGNIS